MNAFSPVRKIVISVRPVATDKQARKLVSVLADVLSNATIFQGQAPQDAAAHLRLVPASQERIKKTGTGDLALAATTIFSCQNKPIQEATASRLCCDLSTRLGSCFVLGALPKHYSFLVAFYVPPSPSKEPTPEAVRAASCLVSSFRNAPGNRGYGYI